MGQDSYPKEDTLPDDAVVPMNIDRLLRSVAAHARGGVLSVDTVVMLAAHEMGLSSNEVSALLVIRREEE